MFENNNNDDKTKLSARLVLRQKGKIYWPKAKETHELIFSWLSWLAVLPVGTYKGGVAQDGGNPSANRLAET